MDTNSGLEERDCLVEMPKDVTANIFLESSHKVPVVPIHVHRCSDILGNKVQDWVESEVSKILEFQLPLMVVPVSYLGVIHTRLLFSALVS